MKETQNFALNRSGPRFAKKALPSYFLFLGKSQILGVLELSFEFSLVLARKCRLGMTLSFGLDTSGVFGKCLDVASVPAELVRKLLLKSLRLHSESPKEMKAKLSNYYHYY